MFGPKRCANCDRRITKADHKLLGGWCIDCIAAGKWAGGKRSHDEVRSDAAQLQKALAVLKRKRWSVWAIRPGGNSALLHKKPSRLWLLGGPRSYIFAGLRTGEITVSAWPEGGYMIIGGGESHVYSLEELRHLF